MHFYERDVFLYFKLCNFSQNPWNKKVSEYDQEIHFSDET